MKTKNILFFVLLVFLAGLSSCKKDHDIPTGEVFNAGSGGSNSGSGVDVSGNYNGYDYVDLGLPSGLLWATSNVGANSPEEYGDYFAWGETQPKGDYSWDTYQYCMGSINTLTKYCNAFNYGYNGYADNLTVLETSDDAATAQWGSGWRMPTQAEWQELVNNTTYIWTTQNGVKGRLFTATNGNSLFLPAAGYHDESSPINGGADGYYWSSSLYTVDPSCVWGLGFGSGSCGMNSHGYRKYGQSVRPVLFAYSIDAESNPTEGGTVSGGGTYQQGQSCTVHATAYSGYTFINWTEGDTLVSTNASYTFNVTGNRTLVANFTYNGGGGNAPTGAINGLFTINANGDQVYFSKGNLQYIGSASTPYWKFADNQWDVLGTTTGQNSSNQNVDRDLFGWGTSGWNCGNTYYNPWDSNYGDGSLYGPPYQDNLTGSYANSDWGVYNPISNGGGQAGLWRTLTAGEGDGEWKYIIDTRSTSSGIRYAKAQVNGVNGVILLPDYWSASYYSLNYTNQFGASFSSNVISASAWASSLEQHGAVFLPAAGLRSGTSVSRVGGYGYYWSASCPYDRYSACYVYFDGSNLNPQLDDVRYFGLSVRLVRSTDGASTYSINTISDPIEGGTVSGGGVYPYGQTCTLMANANDGFSFVNWTENGTQVSTNANYTFTVNGNRTLIAHFTSNIQNYSINVSAYPSNGGTVSGGGTYQQGQTCTVHATANSGYTFTNWTEGGTPVSTNASYTFTVTSNRTLVAHFTYNGGGGHTYVDLGLPSGLLWATCNVGANSPEDYGDYFAWGETQPKSDYSWGTYQYCNGSYNTLTKYCTNAYYGYNGFIDNLATLQPSDDAATAQWGSGWRMPTKEEWQELLNNTTQIWTTQNGVNGRLFTATNGNSLFLPAAGYRDGTSLYYAGTLGDYWSSSLYSENPNDAWDLYFDSGNCGMNSGYRDYGQSVRPVRSASKN